MVYYRMFPVRSMISLTNPKLDRFSTGATYRHQFPVKILPGDTRHSEQAVSCT